MTGAIDSVAYDKYFQNAYYSPNLQQYQMMQQMYASQPVGTTSTSNNPSFKAAAETPVLPKEEKSSSNAGWWILGAAAVIAGGAYCCARKGNGKGLDKVVDGFKNIFNIGKGRAGKAVSLTKEFTVNDKNLCTVPDRTNFMRKGVAAQELGKLGASADAPALTRVVDGKTILGEGVKLRDYTFTHNGNTFRVRKGNVVSYTNSAGENVLARFKAPVESTDVAYQKEIKEMIAKFNRGENLDALSNIRFSHTADGTSRLFSMGKITETPQLQCAVSNKFHIDSDAVVAYGVRNKDADKLLEALKKGEKKDLTIAQAEYVSPSLGTFKIQNGGVAGITVNGAYYPQKSDTFMALEKKNKESFENVLKHKDKFINIVYKAA